MFGYKIYVDKHRHEGNMWWHIVLFVVGVAVAYRVGYWRGRKVVPPPGFGRTVYREWCEDSTTNGAESGRTVYREWYQYDKE